MKKIKFFLSKYGMHAFLLPVFFVLHSYMQYYGLVSGRAALKVLVVTELAFVVFFFISALITKNFQRSAQLTTLTGFIILFYGVIKDFCKAIPGISFLSRYIFLLPLIIILYTPAIRSIRKKPDFSKPNLFQNTLLLLFLCTDGILLLRSGAEQFMLRNQLVKNNIITPDSLPRVTERPDVYLLVFDSYPGTGFLRDYLQYDNTPQDSILINKGFYVARHPSSNYNRTAFSMAATLNMEYLQNIPNQSYLEPKQYNQASLSIEHAVVPAVFIHNGYQVYNLSVFDLARHPALVKENFLVLPEEEMLWYNTLVERLSQDVLWNYPLLKYGHFHMTEQQKQQYQQGFSAESIIKRDFNNKLIDSLQKIPLLDTTRPKFIYAHFYLPHPPFFYDRNGNPLTLNIASVVQSMEQKAAFISYLEYTNKVILKIINALLANPSRQPVIILQSDHGYRDFRKDFVSAGNYFKNYSSFYFPDKNYSSLYHSISNINTFPVIFNKYFKTHIPLQKDSSVFTDY